MQGTVCLPTANCKSWHKWHQQLLGVQSETKKKIAFGSISSQGGAIWRVFLLGQLRPLPYGSRRLCRRDYSTDPVLQRRELSMKAKDSRRLRQWSNYGEERAGLAVAHVDAEKTVAYQHDHTSRLHCCSRSLQASSSSPVDGRRPRGGQADDNDTTWYCAQIRTPNFPRSAAISISLCEVDQ